MQALLVACVLVVSLQAQAFAARNRALLVGISQYANFTIPDLAYADEDVQTLAAWLTNFSDYKESDVTVLLNRLATREGIRNALADIIKESAEKPFDDFILMYAGHGPPGALRETPLLLAPHDANNASEAAANETFLDKKWLAKQLASIRARNTVVILDSCYSGSKDLSRLYADARRQRSDLLASNPGRRGVEIVPGPAGSRALRELAAFLASSREDQESAEYRALRHGALSYSIFEFLNEQLKTASRRSEVTLARLFDGVKELFDRTKVDGKPLSSQHQPELDPFPDYQSASGMRVLALSAKTSVKTGRLSVFTGDLECEVAIDGVRQREPSNHTFEALEGKHLVALYLSKTNYNRTISVDVRAGETTSAQVLLLGTLQVEAIDAESNTAAPELRVYLDGRSMGRTPLSLGNLLAGTHTLVVEVGKAKKQRQIEVRPDSPLLVRYKIIRQAVPVKPRHDGGAGDVVY